MIYYVIFCVSTVITTLVMIYRPVYQDRGIRAGLSHYLGLAVVLFILSPFIFIFTIFSSARYKLAIEQQLKKSS